MAINLQRFVDSRCHSSCSEMTETKLTEMRRQKYLQNDDRFSKSSMSPENIEKMKRDNDAYEVEMLIG